MSRKKKQDWEKTGMWPDDQGVDYIGAMCVTHNWLGLEQNVPCVDTNKFRKGIKNNMNDKIILTGIPCFRCGKYSGIDCPGRKPGEATLCFKCYMETSKDDLCEQFGVDHLDEETIFELLFGKNRE